MSDEKTPYVPPSPTLPKPDLPKPSIPTPSVGGAQQETPRMASFEVEDTSAQAKASAAEPFEDATAAVVEEETILHKRLLGGLIDVAISWALSFAALQVLPEFASKLAWALQISYLLFRDSLPFLGGQSLGKKTLKLRAVTNEGEPLTNNWQAGALRNILFIIPLAGPLVELVILYTRENSSDSGIRLGDSFAKTKVIAENAASAATMEEVSSEEE